MLHSLMFHVFAHAFKLKRLYIYHTATSLGSSEFLEEFSSSFRFFHFPDCSGFPWMVCGMPQFRNLRLATMKPNFGSNYGK